MSEPTYIWVKLLDREGREILRLRIPKREPPIPALQWGAKFYARGAEDLLYDEVYCHFVTLESQFPQTPEDRKRATLEPFAW